ncbi:hypothetical protein IU459_34960 [Nocardia amamiensis]|uniref:Uncharacterized protein n=1 Tax=Nocardia amamiensis TaxID=404578 RepID=A0ABS0D1H3_9NOCA|nr:hypothetical protein [Nocardia amamiensis]MBF6302695.1 hypothetical protein [Nocardia amamiensis]
MTDEELADFEVDVLSEFVLARASAGLTDGSIRAENLHLELVRNWFGRSAFQEQAGPSASLRGEADAPP